MMSKATMLLLLLLASLLVVPQVSFVKVVAVHGFLSPQSVTTTVTSSSLSLPFTRSIISTTNARRRMQETSLLKKKNVSTTNNVITSSCLSSASSDVTTPGGDDNGDEDVDMNNNNNSNSNNRVGEKKRTSTGFSFWYKLPKKAYRVYTGYAKQLWKDTDTSARSRIANDKVAQTIRDMQHVLNNEYYYAATTTTTNTSSGDSESEGNGDTDNKGLVPNATEDELITNEKAKEQLLEACNTMLTVLDDQEDKSKAVILTTPEAEAEKASSKVTKNKTKKKPRSVLFGALMGLTVAGWVFSGDYIFTGLFCLVTILGQLEYYRMIMNTGVFPARRISVVGATSMFVTVRTAVYTTRLVYGICCVVFLLFTSYIPSICLASNSWFTN